MATLDYNEQERNAFIWLQGRLVELLLRHYEQDFNRIFFELSGQPENTAQAVLQRYNKLAVIFYLKEELFEEIIPLIKRKLSFAAPQERLVEDLPPRGRIDWLRTAAAAWQTIPDEIPAQVHTIRRQRHFATPENLLTVCTLLEYQAATQAILDEETLRTDNLALRHPLNEIVDRCRKEAGFLQFAELVPQAEKILSGFKQQIVEDVEQQVETNLLQNYNAAYDKLLRWRRKLHDLRLLDRQSTSEPLTMLGADPQRDNYLYQLWLFYELGNLLQKRQAVKDKGWNYAKMQLQFSWSDAASGESVEYRLQHDQAIGISKEGYWEGSATDWQPRPPGVRPDFYIERLDRRVVRDEKQALIWHEPGYVLDAKFYRPRGKKEAAAGTVKRMISDLQLTGERYGALLFAFLEDMPRQPATATPPDDAEIESTVLQDLLQKEETGPNSNRKLYTLKPKEGSAQYIQSDLELSIWRFMPVPGSEANLQRALAELLNSVHKKLSERVEIKCRGIFLDSLSANAHGEMANLVKLYQRNGELIGQHEKLDDFLLCPKPHVAAWRLDLVSLAADCCKNRQLCHIIDQPTGRSVQAPKRLVSLEDIQVAIQAALTENTDGNDSEQRQDEAVKSATKQVQILVQRYADLIKPDLNQYETWLAKECGQIYLTNSLLGSEQRETLRLACFLSDQIAKVKATNYAGPALLFSGVLEELTRRTIGTKAALQNLQSHEKTLGSICYHSNRISLKNDPTRSRWWKETITNRLWCRFDDWLDDIKDIKDMRNKAAHQAKLSESEFEDLQVYYFGDNNRGLGAFNGLLLAWTG